jgi:cyclin H
LVALQRARREQATTKVKKPTTTGGTVQSDGTVFGEAMALDARDTKRRKLEGGGDLFGPPL